MADGHDNKRREEGAPMIKPSRGAHYSGVILHVFGALTLVGALIGYMYFAVIAVFFAIDHSVVQTKEIFVLLGFWVGAILVHACGQLMMRIGDYMQGKMGGMSQRAIIQSSVYFLLKDICTVQVGFGVICGVGALLAKQWVLVTVVVILITIFCGLSHRLNKQLNDLEKE